jgi:hypothetical protein
MGSSVADSIVRHISTKISTSSYPIDSAYCLIKYPFKEYTFPPRYSQWLGLIGYPSDLMLGHLESLLCYSQSPSGHSGPPSSLALPVLSPALLVTLIERYSLMLAALL